MFAAGSEDMDTLTFGSPVILRHLTFSEARKTPISEIHLDKALEGLDMNMSQFIDLCLLLGCDYLEPIKGVGPKSALKLMKEHGVPGLQLGVVHSDSVVEMGAFGRSTEDNDPMSVNVSCIVLGRP